MASITLRNVKGSALTFTEMDNNFSNLNTDKIESVSADTSPQLGGNLDVNGNSIVSAGGSNIVITPDTTGSIVLDGLNWPQSDGTTGQYLKTDGAGNLSWETVAGATDTTYTISAVTDGANANLRLSGSDASEDDIQLVAGANITLTVDSAGAITIDSATELSADTSPVLGGNLTTAGFSIVSTSQDISIIPGGTAKLRFGNKNILDCNLQGYKEVVFNSSATGNLTVDTDNGPIQRFRLSGNVTFLGFSSAEDGQSVTLILEQDSTGSRTFSEGLDSAGLMLWADGDSTLSTAGGSIDIVTIVYADGIYYASIAKNFS